MPSPSTSRDRVEARAQASGGNDLVDERDVLYAGKPGGGETSAGELSDARAALARAEANMVTAVERAQDQNESQLTDEDIQKAFDEFGAARDRVTQALRYADFAEKRAVPENAHAGMKRGSDSVTRRVTGEGTHRAPAGRPREDGAATMDVDGDGAFARGQVTREVYDRANALLQAGIEEGAIILGDWYGSNDAASRAWLLLRLMRGLIEPTTRVVRFWDHAKIKEFTSRQNTYLRLANVGCVNKAPFAACGALSSGRLFVHTHALPRDSFMVESEEEIDPSLATTKVMLDRDGNSVETAKITHRLHEHTTDQTALDPVQVNMFDFAEFTKEEFDAATGTRKYRAHPKASEIVADAGGHEAIIELLRDRLVGDVVFVGGAAHVELKDQILPKMPDLRIIWFGHKTARLAFPKMGMHAFTWANPEMTAFGIMFCETTWVWRNFMCLHGYGTLNGYTITSQGEPGMADNMRTLVRAGDWLRFMHMKPICDNFVDSVIWRRHIEELNDFAVEEEKTIRRCDDEKKPYFSRPLRMSKEGGAKSAETRRAQPATGEYAGVLMKNGKVCENALQESGKDMAEARRAQPATGEYAGVLMVNGEICENALQESGKRLGDEYGAKSAEARRAQPASDEYAGVLMVNGEVCENALQESGKHAAETLRGQRAIGEYAGAPLAGGGMVGNRLQESGKHMAETRRAQPATGEYAGAPLVGGGTVGNQLQAAGKHAAETLRGQPATGEYAGAPLAGGGTVGNRLQAAGKKLNDEYGSVAGASKRTKPWVSVRASRILNGEDHEFAVFDGSFLTTVNNEVASANVLIQKAGTGNKENYMKMLDKYDEDKQEFKNPVDLPASALKLAFATEMKLEEIVNSLADCLPERPVRLFRRGRRGRELTPDQAINWKFEVIGYLPAETRIAETMAAAGEGAKIH